MKRIVVAAVFTVLASSAFWGQTASAPLTFEVASIKPTAPDSRTTFQGQPDGGLRWTSVSVKTLLETAYNVRGFQISGGPAWIDTDRYDIIAKSEHSASSENLPDDPRKMTSDQRKTYQEQTGERLRALMTERFHLSVHRETKEQPVYALVVSKDGPKLQPAKEGSRGLIWMGPGQITGEGAGIDKALTRVLENIFGRPVIDKTGLTGKFDFKLEWTPDTSRDGGPPGLDAQPPSGPNGPSIFTAVQEQLGLRLESEKGPAEMIVIDRVEKPSEN